MTIIHLDAVGGIAGDMFVAALVDAIPDLRQRVIHDAAAILPKEAYKAGFTEGQSGAVRALRFGLAEDEEQKTRGESDPHVHAPADEQLVPHQHQLGARHHSHNGPHAPASHIVGVGNFCDMVARIRAAALWPGTADQAVAILTLLAEVEADIHNVRIEQVHFHEIADWDSLLDVVAAGSIAAALDGSTWSVSTLPRGDGLVRTQHGLLPVPAPATTALLMGFSWRDDGIGGERVTPTGAAILKHLIKSHSIRVEGRLSASGTGAGTRSLSGMPNVLRALVFTSQQSSERDDVAVISFEIDDMTGEEIGTAADRLRTFDGVLDVSIGQRWGKKNRPMQAFSILAHPAQADAVIELCFVETSTIGLRVRVEQRRVLPRTSLCKEGVGVKVVLRPSGESRKAENDDLTGYTLNERRQAKLQAEQCENA